MRLDVLADGMPRPEGLRAFTRRRLLYALGRFGHAVDHVSVRFSDEDGPRPGGFTCKVLVVPRGGRRLVVIEETGDDLFAAAAHAAERAGRSLSRVLSRGRDDRRPRVVAS